MRMTPGSNATLAVFIKRYPITWKCITNWRCYQQRFRLRLEHLKRLAMCTILLLAFEQDRKKNNPVHEAWDRLQKHLRNPGRNRKESLLRLVKS